MFAEIQLEDLPQGYALTSARAGEEVKLCFREFTSSEDGQYFIQRLEGTPSDVLGKMPSPTSPSQVDNMLVICDSDGNAEVYLNELDQEILVRVAKPVEAGATVTKDDFADVERLELGVSIPNEAGFLFIFSVGWRKGIFYDFEPILKAQPKTRKYDVPVALARAYCHVLFQERFRISDDEWDSLFAAQWFPFTGLRDRTLNELIAQVRSGSDPDEVLDDVVSETKDGLAHMVNAWRNQFAFQPHMKILDRAVERFQNDDFISCTGLVFPRIEGIMRTHHNSLGMQTRSSAGTLTESAVSAKVKNDNSLLLPRRFADYLRDVYFAKFDPGSQDNEVSRHSVSHGVAGTSKFNKKSAVIGLLIINQLSYFLGNGLNRDVEEREATSGA